MARGAGVRGLDLCRFTNKIASYSDMSVDRIIFTHLFVPA